jgi:acetyl-CoA carboxylase biotin carboxyl carrier protein
MPLDEKDVREILRLIDESDVDELRVEIDDLSLHVVRGGALPPAEPPTPPTRAVDGAEPTPPAEVATTDESLLVSAPMLGTFYRAEAPGAPPFVDVGARVEAHTIVCLIEVMKMMNAIPAGVTGTVVAVCAENAELVEYGAPLFRVQPDR